MREIITLQLGNFSNFLGAHFWNIQECGLDPELGADGEPVVHPGHAEPSVLYRQGRKEQERHPRLVLCDGADRFGSLSRDGVVHTEAAHIDESGVDSWGGVVTPAVAERRPHNAFLQMLHSPVSQEWSPGAEAAAAAAAAAAEDEDDDAAAAAEDDGAPAAAKAGDGEEGGMRAADFEFDTSVTAWSDYLQARLHPRSLASLRPHEHEYTDFELWGEGVALARAEGADESRGPMLLERVRRFLEECDAPQGFVLAADVNGGFGGLARELLAQIRDDYSTAPCVALAAGTHAGALPTSTAPSSPGKSGGDAPLEAAHRYRHALHDALALTSFDAELRCTTIPIYGSGALLSAAAHAAAGAAAAAAGASGIARICQDHRR